MKNIFIPSSQPNLNLAASIYESVEKPIGIAILCPGYLDTKDYPDLIELAKDFAQKNYVVASFDPLGTWSSDGSIDVYALEQYQKDIISVQNYMITKYGELAVIIGGKSMGGMMSIVHAAKHPKFIKKVFGIVPPRGAKVHPQDQEWEETGFRISRRDEPSNSGVYRTFQTPYQTIREIHAYDLLGILSRLTVPLLLIAGGKDTTVPSEVVQEIYDTTLGEKKIVILGEINHDYRNNPEHIRLVNSEIIKWLEN